MIPPAPIQVLLVHAREQLCAIRISDLAETMRPLPIASITGSPACVLGVAMIRGLATPVIDLGAALGQPGVGQPTRFLSLKIAGRALALAVDRLIGVQLLDAPQPGVSEKISAIGAIGEKLVFVIDPTRLVPEAA